MTNEIIIIGGGLAGSEAAWQAARRGCSVLLYEMRPSQNTPAHTSDHLAELVCSNSLRSSDPSSAVGLLKEEMRLMGSLIMEAADRYRVPAGKALAVDRDKFAAHITRCLEEHPGVTIKRQEMQELPALGTTPIIMASGPLSSTAITESLRTLTGSQHLAFYDAIAPIVYTESLNMDIIYQASRYDEGPGDYLNCPMDKEQYLSFIKEVQDADKVPLKAFEEQKYFEGCLPIEVMADRGVETLRFGPMKPVGLPDPKTGQEPYAVVQLRKENLENTLHNMVGFQTKLTYGEQQRVFRMIPGMENAEFSRLGSIHRNTFVCGPEVLEPTLQLKSRTDIFLAGQLTGVEGYVESTAMGLLAGLNAARVMADVPLVKPPVETAHGALIAHVTMSDGKHFQPSNINFGLFPALQKKMPKKMRGQYRADLALAALKTWKNENNIG